MEFARIGHLCGTITILRDWTKITLKATIHTYYDKIYTVLGIRPRHTGCRARPTSLGLYVMYVLLRALIAVHAANRSRSRIHVPEGCVAGAGMTGHSVLNVRRPKLAHVLTARWRPCMAWWRQARGETEKPSACTGTASLSRI
jgi:hypothetical protein